MPCLLETGADKTLGRETTLPGRQEEKELILYLGNRFPSLRRPRSDHGRRHWVHARPKEAARSRGLRAGDFVFPN